MNMLVGINRVTRVRCPSFYNRLSPYCYYNYVSFSAHQMFDRIPERQEGQKNKSNVTQGLQLFRMMHASGTKITRFVLCTALNSCAKTLNLELGLQIHACVIRYGYEQNLFISSALVNLYAKSSAIRDARKVFDGMKRHDQVSWTSIITGFSQNRHGVETILVFKEMLSTEIKPNCFTYVSVISACTCLDEPFSQVVMLHAHVIKLGFKMNSFVVSALIDCYSKYGEIDHARLVFDESIERDNILFNSMISGYSQNLLGEEALKLFVKMRNENLDLTEHTLTSILSSCGSLTVLGQGRQIHSLVIKMGCERNTFVVTSLTDMYTKCGTLDEARSIFDQTVEKSSVLWTSMIMGYAQSGRGFEALKLFDQLVSKEAFIPDHICFTAILTACNHAGLLEMGLEYFNMMKDYGLNPELDQYACLIELNSRKGNLREANELMELMPYEPNYVMWSSFLNYCNVYGEVALGREAFNELLKMEPGNAAPYVTLANIYAKAGLWAEVTKIRGLMQKKGIRKSAGWSWVEVEKRVHVFSVGDGSHPQSREIYGELEKLNLEMKEAGNKNKYLCGLEDIVCE